MDIRPKSDTEESSLARHLGSYLNLHASGELAARAKEAREILACCDLCAHECRVDRRRGGHGFCRVGDECVISGYGPHFGEEDVLVGTGGSGTIFFTGCNLRCVFCQNWEISHLREGMPVSAVRLAEIMVELQERGCHNINLVSPTPYLPSILAALNEACGRGLNLPLVYNCGGYESLSALRLLRAVIDIYMPDVKLAGEDTGRRLTGAKGYFAAVKKALREMHDQVGDLRVDEDGLAWRGLLVRHLVMPGGLAGTEEVLRFLAEEISPDTYVNIMGQYHPAFRAAEHPPLDRRISRAEYREALETARRAGLWRFAR
ncbi:MAG: radical SAM protein [Bacteroidota bacterium]